MKGQREVEELVEAAKALLRIPPVRVAGTRADKVNRINKARTRLALAVNALEDGQ